MMSRIVALMAALAFAWTVQDQRPPFRTGVELVQLDVAVLDDQRVPVRGLTAADFTVLESGQPKSIRSFSAIDLPARDHSTDAAWTNSVPPDVATNVVGTQDGRLVVILMDRSINSGAGVATARKIASAVVGELGPGDLAAVVSTSGGVPQNLTMDHTRLLATINQRDWSTDGTDPYLNPPFTLDSPLQDGRCLCGVCVLDTITNVSDAVRYTPRRRKLLVFVGTGAVLQVALRPPTGDVGCDTRVNDARNRMFASLAVSNLTIHAVDTKGLVNVGPQTSVAVHGAQGGPDTAGPRQRLQMQQTETTDLMDLHSTLRVLADKTGGRAVMDTNAPEAKVPEIFRESESYYLLAFERDPNLPADATRPLEIKVNRKGAHVYAQRRYAPLPQTLSTGQPLVNVRASLMAAVAGLLPSASAPLALTAPPFALAAGDNAVLSIVIDTGTFAQAAASVPLEVRVAAFSAEGRQGVAAQQTSTIPAVAGVGGRPPVVNVPTHLELPPGDYEIRAAVADPLRGRVASVFQQVSVPAFARAPLTLSGIAIEMSAGGIETVTAADAEVSPITARTFARADHVRAAFEVYQGTQRSDAIVPVSVRLAIADAHGKTVHEESVALTAQSFLARRARLRLALPLARLEPGDYALRIEARTAQQASGRALRFTVE
jgi:VWFA-related protein